MMTFIQPFRRAALCLSACLFSQASVAARADAVATLRSFAHDVQSGRAAFTQTVTSPDGKKVRKSTGTLELLRPNRFRFEYKAPTEQVIVGDGKKVWLYDADLNQVTVRPMGQAVGATPAALLAGGDALERDFILQALPQPAGGASDAAAMAWVQAVPRQKDGQFQSVKVGFKGTMLAALEVLDSFGQTSRLDFSQFDTKVAVPAARFVFTPPPGADVLNQP